MQLLSETMKMQLHGTEFGSYTEITKIFLEKNHHSANMHLARRAVQ